MAPNIKLQTDLVVFYLLEDEDDKKDSRSYGEVEADSAVESNDSFDPVIVADRLRTIGDALNKDPEFNRVIKPLGEAITDEVVAAVFEKGVETLCASYASQDAEVAPELQLIRASVAVGLYLKKKSPALKDKVKNALTAFLDRRVNTWVAQQGGWGKVPVSE